MISIDFFRLEMNKLDEQFGHAKFSKHKKNLIYNHVKKWTEEEFVRRIDHIVGNFNHAPKLEDFYSNNNVNEKYECSICNGAGLLTKSNENGIGSFAYRCDCKNGDKYRKNFLTLDQIRRLK